MKLSYLSRCTCTLLIICTKHNVRFTNHIVCNIEKVLGEGLEMSAVGVLICYSNSWVGEYHNYSG